MLEKLPEAFGQALVNQRAGMENVLYNQLHRARQTARMDVHSSAFAFNARLPARFTADGEGLSPPLAWGAPPAAATSVVLMVEDADAPTPHPLVHAIVVGLPGTAGSLEEGALSSPDHEGIGLDTGRNSYLRHAWLPPDPPPGHGEHRYVFQVFALRDGVPDEQRSAVPSGKPSGVPSAEPSGVPIPKSPGRGEFIQLVLDRAIACGCVIGTYERESRETASVLEESLGLATPAAAY